MIRLCRLIRERGMTQVAAARLFAVSQPRVSDLVRGKIGLFSIDMLVNMLARTGAQVTFSVKSRSRVA